jgi:putative alpha-1,2-mannosidase
MARAQRIVLLLSVCVTLLILSQQPTAVFETAAMEHGGARASHEWWQQKRSANPFIGTAGFGHCTPGAHAPFGMITLAPLTAGPNLQDPRYPVMGPGEYSAGYQHKDSVFRGMAHTATSGAGIVLGLDVAVSPFRNLGGLENEHARPGYYSAILTEGDPTRPVMEREARRRASRHQERKQKARLMLRARRQAIKTAQEARAAARRGRHNATTSPPPPPQQLPPPPSPPSPPMPADLPSSSTSSLPSSRITAQFSAGTRYGIHRYIYSPGITPPRLYFRDVNIRYVPLTPAAAAKSAAAAKGDARSTASPESEPRGTFIPRCAVEGNSSAKGSWAAYTIFMYAELSEECNQTASALESAAVAAADDAIRREATRKAIAFRQQRRAQTQTPTANSYEDVASDRMAELIDVDEEQRNEPTLHFNSELRVKSHLETALPPAALDGTRTLEMHIAISYVDVAGAKRNFAAERTSWQGLLARTSARWKAALGTVAVEHHTRRDAEVFDTALYHTMVAPYVHSDVDGRFLGPDGQVHVARNFTYYSFLSTWDTYRAWGPLMCRLMPGVMLDLVRTSLLHHAIVGVLPRWTWAGKDTSCMPAIHSMTLMWQAVAHGLTTPELDTQIYEAYLHTTKGSSEFRTGWGNRRANYEMREVVANDGVLFDAEQNQQTVSEALEYAVVFRCVANMARHMADRKAAGRSRAALHGGARAAATADVASRSAEDNAKAQEARFKRLSLVYRRLYDNRTGYYSGMLRDGTVVPEQRPLHASSSGLWTEGSAIQWLFHVMHDFSGLLELMGRRRMLERLEILFTATGTSNLVDTTGLIGSYAQGNEPSHHVIFWYFLLGLDAKAVRSQRPALERQARCSHPFQTPLAGNQTLQTA